MTVDGCNRDAILAKRLDDWIDLFPGENKIAGGHRLRQPTGWKLIAVATPMELGTVIPALAIPSARGTEN